MRYPVDHPDARAKTMGNEFGDSSLNPRGPWSSVVTWERPFDQPVPLPNGPPARTLRDAANYIKKLPASERETPECRLAIQIADRCC
jgi:hypothetical protein